MMTVYLNNQPLLLPIETSLQTLLQHGAQLNPDLELSNVAAVVNQQLVPKSTWQLYQCQPNDQVELFSPVAGG
jgi:thiamine biosynthesis protein ThiS